MGSYTSSNDMADVLFTPPACLMKKRAEFCVQKPEVNGMTHAGDHAVFVQNHSPVDCYPHM